jgi:hypothetical protein
VRLLTRLIAVRLLLVAVRIVARLIAVRLLLVAVRIARGREQRIVAGHFHGTDHLALGRGDRLLHLRLVVDVAGVEHHVRGLDRRSLRGADVEVVRLLPTLVQQVHLGTGRDLLGHPGQRVHGSDHRQAGAGGFALRGSGLVGRHRRRRSAAHQQQGRDGEGRQPAAHEAVSRDVGQS